jgi:hypothetical protein
VERYKKDLPTELGAYTKDNQTEGPEESTVPTHTEAVNTAAPSRQYVLSLRSLEPVIKRNRGVKMATMKHTQIQNKHLMLHSSKQ